MIKGAYLSPHGRIIRSTAKWLAGPFQALNHHKSSRQFPFRKRVIVAMFLSGF